MKMGRFFWGIGLFGLVLAQSAQAQQVVPVAVIDWCPHICQSTDQKGYVLDIAVEVFRAEGIELKIKFVPWSRAIEMTQSGQTSALLAPAKSEAPMLRYPEYPVGYQQICFFTHQLAAWRFVNERDLVGKRIGIANDVSIPTLENFIMSFPQYFHFQPYHENFVERNVRMVIRGRLDAFLFTKNSLLYTLQKLGFEKDIKEAGCVPKEPIYMAFSPAPEEKAKINDLMRLFDKGMARLQKSGRITEILASYGLDP